MQNSSHSLIKRASPRLSIQCTRMLYIYVCVCNQFTIIGIFYRNKNSNIRNASLTTRCNLGLRVRCAGKQSSKKIQENGIISACHRVMARAWRKWARWGVSRRTMSRRPRRTERNPAGHVPRIRLTAADVEFSCCRCWFSRSYRSWRWSCRRPTPYTISWSIGRRSPTSKRR